jgi:sec-independent protein translocase protein TatC
MAPDSKMGFLDHLGELRKSLIRMTLALACATVISLFFTPRVLSFLLQPYGLPLSVIGPTEGISIYLRIGLTCGAALSMPYILLELWRFISPALMPRERRFIFFLLPSSLALFICGVCFAWFVLIPAAVRFLADFKLGIFETAWTSENYIPFVTNLIFWIGICFELPVAVYVLAKLRFLSPRLMLRAWRHAMVLACAAAAIITPTVDPFNMMLVAIPLAGLYFLSILFAAFAQREGHRKRLDRGGS